MDKVIIDGVDVSGCEHYKIGTCVADYLLTDMNFSEAKCKLCPNCYYKQLQRAKVELKKYEDMAKKGLEEFKDVGGCWGCGIQESLNQAWADCKTYRQALQKIKDIADRTDGNHPASVINMVSVIRHTINSVIGAEE